MYDEITYLEQEVSELKKQREVAEDALSTCQGEIRRLRVCLVQAQDCLSKTQDVLKEPCENCPEEFSESSKCQCCDAAKLLQKFDFIFI